MQTKTYAEILARQGEFDQAMAIYRALIGQKPFDESLKKRLAELEALAAGLLLGAPPPKPKSRIEVRLEALLHRIQGRRR